jgi:molecular chaperone GrpE
MITINKEVNSLLDKYEEATNSDEVTNEGINVNEESLKEEVTDNDCEVENNNTELDLLHNKISSLELELEEAKNKYLRLQADFENNKRRAKLDYESALKYGIQNLVTNLLPALDNFERALNIEAENDQAKSILQGVEMVYKQLQQALVNEGLEIIQAEGQQFDPYIHQAVMQINDDSYEPNIIVQELQKGYKLKDKVIRPSMVKVNG